MIERLVQDYSLNDDSSSEVKLLKGNEVIGRAVKPSYISEETLRCFLEKLLQALPIQEKQKLVPSILESLLKKESQESYSQYSFIVPILQLQLEKEWRKDIQEKVEQIKSQVAEKILQEEKLYYLKGELLVKSGTTYLLEPQSLKLLEERIVRIYYNLELDKARISKKNFVNDVLNEIKIRALVIDEKKINPSHLMAFKNAILNKIDLSLAEENADYVLTSSVDYDLDLSFIEKLKNNEVAEEYFKDKLFYKTIRRFYDDENWQKIKNAFGALLSPYVLRLLIFVVGEKRTGKSTLANLIKKAFGSYSCSVDLVRVNSYTFALEPFIHSYINISEEAPDTTVKSIEKIKALVGGSVLSIPRKFKETLTLEGKPIIWLAFCNNLPVFENLDEAFADRVSIVFTSNPLTQEETDEDISVELSKEENVKDFFNFILFCYNELRKKKFKIPRDIETNLELLTLAHFPLNDWVKERCDESVEFKVKREDAYNDFVEWAKKNPSKVRKIYSRKEFYEIMRRRYSEIKLHGKNCFKGLKLRA